MGGYAPDQNMKIVAELTGIGIDTFPCDPASKRPLVKGWRETADEDTRSRQWQRFPHAMPGLDCERTGVVVIDCDKTDEVDGEANFRELCNSVGVSLTHVPCVSTPRGGRHFYFARPSKGGVKNSAGSIARGVDVRGDGGFVVAPGSVRADGRRYHTVEPASLDDLLFLLGNKDLPVEPLFDGYQ